MKQKKILKHNSLNNELNNTFILCASLQINNLLYTPSERATGINDMLPAK